MKSADEQYIEIGYIARSHGKRGEVLLVSEYDVPDLFNYCRIIRYHNERGDLVPARVVNARTQYKNNRLAFFVQLTDITDRNSAEQLKDKAVFVERNRLEELDLESSGLPYLNFVVYDEENNEVGTVNDVMETAAHWLLEVELKEPKDKQILVPAVDEYIRSVNEEQNTLYCQNLDVLMQI